MKKTVMIIGILVVYLIASATVAVASKIPDWVNDPKVWINSSEAFEKDGYIYGVGKSPFSNIASARNSAASWAKWRLIQYFKNTKLSGVEIVKYYKVGRITFALARKAK